jgi:hypothetical protein
VGKNHIAKSQLAFKTGALSSSQAHEEVLTKVVVSVVSTLIVVQAISIQSQAVAEVQVSIFAQAQPLY